MPEPIFFAANEIAQQTQHSEKIAIQISSQTAYRQAVQSEKARLDQLLRQLRQKNARPEVNHPSASFSPDAVSTPRSGTQLYHQRWAALRTGQLYTQLPPDSFWSAWNHVSDRQTYEQWRSLLQQEASTTAKLQGNQRLGILLGDSISLWFPSDRLPKNQLWLNQGISGDTTGGILRRLSDFSGTRPQVIYVMAGVNDLKTGVSDRTILSNLQQIVLRLRQTHPQAQIVMQSILPTGVLGLSNDHIYSLNQQLRVIATQNGAYYLDVYSQMTDGYGNLRPELTTDGLHLSAQGYATWQAILHRADLQIAQTVLPGRDRPQ